MTMNLRCLRRTNAPCPITLPASASHDKSITRYHATQMATLLMVSAQYYIDITVKINRSLHHIEQTARSNNIIAIRQQIYARRI